MTTYCMKIWLIFASTLSYRNVALTSIMFLEKVMFWKVFDSFPQKK